MTATPIVDRIKSYKQRCEEHPEHQSGMITHGMCYARMNEECEEVYAVARELERMCEEFDTALDCAWHGCLAESKFESLRYKLQAMKEKAK